MLFCLGCEQFFVICARKYSSELFSFMAVNCHVNRFQTAVQTSMRSHLKILHESIKAKADIVINIMDDVSHVDNSY